MTVTHVDFQRASAVRQCAADIAERRALAPHQARSIRTSAQRALRQGASAAFALCLASREARAFQSANATRGGAA
jgi:hypothetical protein